MTESLGQLVLLSNLRYKETSAATMSMLYLPKKSAKFHRLPFGGIGKLGFKKS